ncbi:MAG: cytosine permease, partial [Sandaracinaceae bacterium]|nr:cytosine permease [Sandaracinaceae bacterium]
GASEPLVASAAVRWVVAVIALFGVGVATISVNIAANVVSPANDFANLAPRHISFKTGGLITGVLGIVMMPWKLMASAGAYIFTWLIGYSALLGPIAGIMLVDYWIVRKRTLDVPDLYRTKGRYAGVDPVALVALVLGVAPNVPGFLKEAGALRHVPVFFEWIYPYAWFTGVILAGGIYLIGRLVVPHRTA